MIFLFFFPKLVQESLGILASLCCRECALYHHVPVNTSSLNEIVEKELREYLVTTFQFYRDENKVQRWPPSKGQAPKAEPLCCFPHLTDCLYVGLYVASSSVKWEE